MLSDRLNLADSKKFCDMSNRTSSPIPSNSLTENSNGKRMFSLFHTHSAATAADAIIPNDLIMCAEPHSASTGNNSEEATDLSETKAITASAMDYFKTTTSNNNGDAFGTTTTTINNNKLITNNNANIKNERFSPPQQMQLHSTAQSNGGGGGGGSANTDAHSSHSR